MSYRILGAQAIIIACALLFSFSKEAISQPDTLWTSRFRGAIGSSGGDAIRTSDGGFAAAGAAQLEGRRDPDFGLVKTDSNGQPEWSARYEFQRDSVNRADVAKSLLQMPDNGYVLAGLGDGGGDGWIVRTDSVGQLLWHQMLMGDLEYCTITNDENILVCDNHGIANLDDQNEGEIIWQREYENIRLSGITNCDDGGFLLYGTSSGPNDMYAVRIDSEGEIQWEAAYGTESADYCLAATQTQDGGWCLVGDAVSGEVGQDFEHFALIVRIDAEGNQIWQHIYQGGEDWHYLLSVCETPDGGITAAGTGRQGYYLLRTDYFGEELWHDYYGGDICYSLLSMNDCGYTLAGYNGRSPGCLLVRTEPDPVVIPFELSSPSHDFGETFVDSVAYYELTVTNSCRRYADILHAEATSRSEVFAVEFGELPHLFPGDSTILRLVFSPDSALAYEGVLSLFFGADTVADTLEVDLAGMGIPNVGVPGESAVAALSVTALLDVSPNPFNSTLTLRIQSPHAIAGGVGGASLESTTSPAALLPISCQARRPTYGK